MEKRLTADLNVVANSNLEIQLLDGDLNIIQKLDDEPNDVGGLTSAELKAKFDESGNIIKKYINETLIPAVLTDDATEESRKQAEAARVAAEQGRVTAEEGRVSAEAARAAAEQARSEAESSRVSAENAREAAEQARADETAGIVARATAQANAAAGSASQAAGSEQSAKDAAGAATGAASSASQSAAAASGSASQASAAAAAAAQSAANGETANKNAQSWAVGGTGTRPGEDTNNAKYWAEHAEAVAGGDFATKSEAQGYVTAHNENVEAHHDLRVAVAGSVRYDAAQSLTDAQKAQARGNIGAVSTTELEELKTTLLKNAQGYHHNLLDNWYFPAAVNQRGATGAITSGGYFLDRWKRIGNTPVTYENGILTLSSSAGGYCGIDQRFDEAFKSTIVGQVATLSIMFGDGTLVSKTVNIRDNVENVPVYFGSGASYSLIDTRDNMLCFRIVSAGDDSFSLKAVKFELGDQQTLARRGADDKWVLNEIPDYGEQLARCQRYYVDMANAQPIYRSGLGIGAWPTVGSSLIVPVPMRAKPAIVKKTGFVLEVYSGTTNYVASNLIVTDTVQSNTLPVQVTVSQKFSSYTEAIISVRNFALSADL